MLTLNEAAVIEGLFADYEHTRKSRNQELQDVALNCDPLAILAAQNIHFDSGYTLEETPRKPNEPGEKIYKASISFSLSDYMIDFEYKLRVSFKSKAAYISIKSGAVINGKQITTREGIKLDILEALYVLLPVAPDLSNVMDVTEDLIELRYAVQKKIA
jgi:hypothetical protein